ncbi:MAG: tryptophan synthase subunit beta [Bacteroidaceae bacterium]|nr:tryptophan synthase subunit beta [Bacteroidaceae bacterium]
MNTDLFKVNERGFYGRYGGTYVPEILKPNCDALSDCYRDILESHDFQAHYRGLLRDYVGRPSPLWLSPSLSVRLGCKVYLKREDLNHTGAHKINNALGQILLARAMGKRRIIAETGAGQHGLAAATVCALFDMPCTIYMGSTDIARQQPNVAKMRLLGADVRAVESGNQTLKDAVNEALRDWCSHPSETFYMIGSAVGPHPYPDLVARLQSIISEEIKEQLLEKEGRDFPDTLVACLGGGSNAAGTFFHYLNEPRTALYCAEADGLGTADASAATILRGSDGILHGARTIVMQDDDGQITEPVSISAGLDYPGVGPLHAHLAASGRAMMIGVTDDEALSAAYALNCDEGILPAIESAHALAALNKINLRKDSVVVVTLSGRGDKDIDTYLNHAPSRKD